MSLQDTAPLFDSIDWKDPLSGTPLVPIITARTPSGVPISGVLQIKGTDKGYPIVDCIARVTPELAEHYRDWLAMFSLLPPVTANDHGSFQHTDTVESFGWQWTWNSSMRTEDDLKMRVAGKFDVNPSVFQGQLVMDAGAGAGDQSRYLLSLGADVVSVDLSAAIEVVARKLRMNSNWVGIQGDIMRLPFSCEQFDIIYCEGVIQHTADSVKTIRELFRVLKEGGQLLAAHYTRTPALTFAKKLKRRLTLGYYDFLRNNLCKMERFKLLFVTGVFAALNYVPILGYLMRKTGTVHYYDIMPDFKTTWTNTYDFYGNHSFQRIIAPDEFRGYFESAGNMRIIFEGNGNIVARKTSSNNSR